MKNLFKGFKNNLKVSHLNMNVFCRHFGSTHKANAEQEIHPRKLNRISYNKTLSGPERSSIQQYNIS